MFYLKVAFNFSKVPFFFTLPEMCFYGEEANCLESNPIVSQQRIWQKFCINKSQVRLTVSGYLPFDISKYTILSAALQLQKKG
jgi:hypothetical protein